MRVGAQIPKPRQSPTRMLETTTTYDRVYIASGGKGTRAISQIPSLMALVSNHKDTKDTKETRVNKPLFARFLCVFVSLWLPTLGSRDPLAGEHGSAREESLVAGPFVAVVVEKLEIPFAQLEERDIGGRADVQRTAVAEHLEGS